jgi:HD-GYP domain-containing protein (c-di-GMP phosphodiesterase class II)
MSISDALDIIRNGRATQFDPHVVDAFISQLDTIKALYAASAQTPNPDNITDIQPAGDLSTAAA